MAQDVADGKVSPDQITEDTIGSYLDTAGVPDPDLLISTSGEQRLPISLCGSWHIRNFILPMWHGRISIKAELVQAIEKYNQRDRRYGGVKEEVRCLKHVF